MFIKHKHKEFGPNPPPQATPDPANSSCWDLFSLQNTGKRRVRFLHLILGPFGRMSRAENFGQALGILEKVHVCADIADRKVRTPMPREGLRKNHSEKLWDASSFPKLGGGPLQLHRKSGFRPHVMQTEEELRILSLSGPISRDTADTIAAIPHIARYFLREVSTPPKMVRYPPFDNVLSFTQAHLCGTPFCNISRDNCAIPH